MKPKLATKMTALTTPVYVKDSGLSMVKVFSATFTLANRQHVANSRAMCTTLKAKGRTSCCKIMIVANTAFNSTMEFYTPRGGLNTKMHTCTMVWAHTTPSQ